MGYAVKELFYTLQGEGANAGRAAVFLRFTGCNLWTGRAQDRGRGRGGCSRWCDTDFVGTDGTNGGTFLTAASLASAVAAQWIPRAGKPFVVCTGGEPALQLDEALVNALRSEGFEVAVETNGTIELPGGIHWVCVSPKANSTLVVQRGNEIKLVYPQAGAEPERYEALDFQHFFLQPLDGPSLDENTDLCARYCLENPRWRLSLQTHKFAGLR